MFFFVPRARQTRRTVWSGVSLNRSRSPSGPASTFLVSEAASRVSRRMKPWKFTTSIFAACSACSWSGVSRSRSW